MSVYTSLYYLKKGIHYYRNNHKLYEISHNIAYQNVVYVGNDNNRREIVMIKVLYAGNDNTKSRPTLHTNSNVISQML